MATVVAGCVDLDSTTTAAPVAASASKVAFADLPYWDDGLAEMCYYDATDRIYGSPRQYTRTMLMNREWIDPATMVKAVGGEMAGMTPVFKITIAEEIPTENYNYRYLVSQYLRRSDLRFEKLATSSQEWCGTTFKQLRRGAESLTLKGFSYFEGEGDREWKLPADQDVYPSEALYALARQVASTQSPCTVQVLAPLRSTHLQAPELTSMTLSPAAATRRVKVPAGAFEARVMTLKHNDQLMAEFVVAAQPPYLLLRYDGRDNGLSFELRAVEKRAYWDRSSKSSFYRSNQAP